MQNEVFFLNAYARDGGFLQSGLWRAFQETTKRTTILIEGDGYRIMGVIHSLPMIGRYLYIPRGPVMKGDSTEKEAIADKLRQAAEETRSGFVRIEPTSGEELETWRKLFGERLIKAPRNVQPQAILAVDIAPSEEELLAAMKPKTRYNIRLAEKKGVRVFATREKKYQEAFLDLVTATAGRKGIAPHPRAYYERFFSSLPEDKCFLFVAEREGEVLAANIVVVFGTWAYYVHGGSSDRHRDMMAPYLLQWEQMRFAKDRGCVKYDFGGAEEKTDGSWAGITRFKQGFSPSTALTIFSGSYDIIFDMRAYALYRHSRFLGRMIGRIKNFFKI